MQTRSRRVSGVLALAWVCALVLGTTGCALWEDISSEPAPSNSVSQAPGEDPDAESPTEEEPLSLVPDGTADENIAFFGAVVERVWQSEERASGRAYVDALVDAGFNRADMQVTEDRSTVGNAAESLQFSVSWGDQECLIGQVGPSTGDPVVAVMPQLAEGRCLIGNTRTIDW